MDAVKPEAPTTLERVSDWTEVVQRLTDELEPDDLVIVLSARRDALAWDPALEQLPARLADLVPESFIIMFPSETVPDAGHAPAEAVLPRSLAPGRILIGIQGESYDGVLRRLLETEFASDPERLDRVHAAVCRSVEAFMPEIQPGVIVPHARLPELDSSMMFLGTSQEGVEFPGATEPARLIFVVLTPEDQPLEHLTRLAEIVRIAADPDRVRALIETGSLDGLDPGSAHDRLTISARGDDG